MDTPFTLQMQAALDGHRLAKSPEERDVYRREMERLLRGLHTVEEVFDAKAAAAGREREA